MPGLISKNKILNKAITAKKEIVVVACGYFNPLHIGHVRYLEAAKKLGDKLVVIVNSDYQVKLKGSFPFMPQKERGEIIKALRCVDGVVLSIDKDRTTRRTIQKIHPDIFAKGGDSTPDNVPEMDVCRKIKTKIVFGVGGGKIQSSSWLVKR